MPLQKFTRVRFQHLGKPANDFQAGVVPTGFELSQIAPTDASIVGKRVLRQPFLKAQPAQVGGEEFPQVHAGSQSACQESAPRYTKQSMLRKGRLRSFLLPLSSAGCGNGGLELLGMIKRDDVAIKNSGDRDAERRVDAGS